MNIEIISPEEVLYKGEVEYVQMPGSDGSFGILQNHAPMIAGLVAGDILLKEKSGTEKTISINGGLTEVFHNKIMVLAK